MDIFHEQLVKHHRTAADYLKIVGIIVGDTRSRVLSCWWSSSLF